MVVEMSDPFEFAKKMELDGIRLYETMRDSTSNQIIKQLCIICIGHEKSHYKTFEELSRHNIINVHSNSFYGITNLFKSIKDKSSLPPQNIIEFYNKVLKAESDSVEFYKKMAQNEKNELIKSQINIIIDEEKKHLATFNQIKKLAENPESTIDSNFNGGFI